MSAELVDIKRDYKYTPEQVAAHRAAWYAFLREHPEMQGRGALHEILPDGREKMCCLGAGCAVLIARGVAMRVAQEGGFVTYDEKSALPPGAFVEAMGLLSQDPIIVAGGSGHRFASDRNDSGIPWPAIADALEAAFPADAEAIRRAREAA